MRVWKLKKNLLLLLFICHDIIYFLYNCIYLICITTVNLPNESLRLPQLRMWPFDLFSVTRLYRWQVDLSMTWHVDDLICYPHTYITKQYINGILGRSQRRAYIRPPHTAHCAAFDRYLLPARPTAALLPQRRVTDKWDRRMPDNYIRPALQ